MGVVGDWDSSGPPVVGIFVMDVLMAEGVIVSSV